MRLKIVEACKESEERVEIYCKQQTSLVKSIIQLVKGNQPDLIGTYNEEKQIIDIEKVYYFEAVEKKCFAYLEKKVLEVSYTLAQIEEDLKEYGFIRINKSSIVCIYKIEKLRCAVNMRVIVVLDNGEELVISRHYKKTFEAYLKSKRGLK